MKKTLLLILISVFMLMPMALTFWVTQPMVANQKIEHVPVVNTEMLQQHVEMLSETFSNRNFWHVETLDQAADYIKTIFDANSDQTFLQTYQVENQSPLSLMVH